MAPSKPSDEHMAIGQRMSDFHRKNHLRQKVTASRMGIESKDPTRMLRFHFDGYYLTDEVIQAYAKAVEASADVFTRTPIKQEPELIYCPTLRQGAVSSFTFGGPDVLALLSFIQLLDEKKVLNEATVNVAGLSQYTDTHVNVTGRINSFTFDDYVRSFVLSSNAGLRSVGGDNAALEDIRSIETTISLPKDYIQEILKNNTSFTLYLSNQTFDLEVVQPYLLNEYLTHMAIAALKKLKQPQKGVEFLIANAQSMIKATGEAELIADAFKSFSTCYQEEKIAEAVFLSLESIFADLMNKGQYRAAVYALESIGYCTRYHNGLIHKLLDFSTKLMSDMGNTLITAHKDLRLALYAAFNQPREIVVFPDIIKKICDVNYQLMELALFDSYGKIHIVSYR